MLVQWGQGQQHQTRSLRICLQRSMAATGNTKTHLLVFLLVSSNFYLKILFQINHLREAFDSHHPLQKVNSDKYWHSSGGRGWFASVN